MYPSRVCTNFIEKMIIPNDSRSFQKDNIISYINDVYDNYNELTNWSVLLANNTISTKTPFDIGGFEIGIANRQKHIGRDSSPIIWQNKLFDTDLDDGKDREPNNPLLILHIIDCDGSVNNGYEPWNTNTHIIGLVIVFPQSLKAIHSEQEYVSTWGVQLMLLDKLFNRIQDEWNYLHSHDGNISKVAFHKVLEEVKPLFTIRLNNDNLEKYHVQFSINEKREFETENKKLYSGIQYQVNAQKNNHYECTFIAESDKKLQFSFFLAYFFIEFQNQGFDLAKKNLKLS